MSICICTIASRHYLVQAVAALESTMRNVTAVSQAVLLAIDLDVEDLRRVFPHLTIFSHTDLDGASRLRLMREFYSPSEYAFALKPELLKHLLKSTTQDKFLYIDSDIYCFSEPVDAPNVVEDAEITLYPHLFPRSDVPHWAAQKSILRHGLFNAGMIGGRRSAAWSDFLEWWSARLTLHGRVRLDLSECGDQRWLDLVPSLFGSAVSSKSPTVNVGHWRLLSLQVTNGQLRDAHGNRVAIGHFSGIAMSPDRPLLTWTPTNMNVELLDAWKSLAEHYRSLIWAQERALAEELKTVGGSKRIARPRWTQLLLHDLHSEGIEASRLLGMTHQQLQVTRLKRGARSVARRLVSLIS